MLHLPQGGMLLVQTQGIPQKRGKGRPPPQGDCPSWRKTTETTREVQANPQVMNFMRQHKISMEHAIELMGNYYSHNNAVVTWQETVEEELAELINLDF